MKTKSIKIVNLFAVIILIASVYFVFITKKTEFEFEYSSKYDGYVLTKYLGYDKSVKIPDQYKSKKIIGIANRAFYKNNDVKNIVFGKNILIISNESFALSKIESIELNDELEYIGYAAFYNCVNLKKINLEKTSLLEIYPYAFSGCLNLEISLSFPNSLTKIHNYAFQNCYSIEYVTLNEGLVYIGDGAFNHCRNAKNKRFIIPNSLIQIGGDTYVENNDVLGTHVFYDFASKNNCLFIVEKNNQNYCSIDGVLYTKINNEPKYLVAYPEAKKDVVYYMPNSVVDAYELSFGKNEYLRDIYLSDSFIIYEVFNQEKPKNYLNTGNNLATAIYCRNYIENIYTNLENQNFTAIDGILYSKNLKKAIYVPIFNSTDEELVIKDGVEEIINGAFYFNDLTESFYENPKLKLPSSLISIHENSLGAINETNWIIEFESNGYYQLSDGKIIRAEQ